MAIVRLNGLSHNEREKIRKRQFAGTMTEHYDKQGFLCYDDSELLTYQPRKKGRPIAKTKITKNKKRG